MMYIDKMMLNRYCMRQIPITHNLEITLVYLHLKSTHIVSCKVFKICRLFIAQEEFSQYGVYLLIFWAYVFEIKF